MKSVLPFLLVVAISAQADAADLFVDAASGSDANVGLSWATARATIGSALSTAAASLEPDLISVAAGRYAEQLVVPSDTTLLGGFPSGGGAPDPVANPTLLDGGGADGSVVHFPPGSNGTALEGFIVRGGRGSVGAEFVTYGGGILVEDAAPLIRGNIVEQNQACRGAGIALVYSAAGPAAQLVDNWIRNNAVAPDLRRECARGVRSEGGGVYVVGPGGADLGLILIGNRIAWNEAVTGGGLRFSGQGSMEHDIVQQNTSGLGLSGGPINVFNVVVTENPGGAVALTCGGTYRLENVTLAANGSGVTITGDPAAGGELAVENTILWQNRDEVDWGCAGGGAVVTSSLVQGGFPAGVGIIDADPVFASGPAGRFYLSQVPAGQAVTSPAVDAGSRPSMAAGLDQRTTATDSVPDAGPVDLGFHSARVLALTVLRGTEANALAPHRAVAALPFTDDPGTLSDPLLPLLFYEVPEAENQLGVEKDLATDAVRLVFR